MQKQQIALTIEAGKASLGIELGSTRIKAVLIGEDSSPLASSAHEWENRLENGIWTYSLESVWAGLQDVYKKLADTVMAEYGVALRKIGAIGISAMMHGYLPFDKDGAPLAAFRTWRNTMTERAASELTKELNFNIPQRWSIAHLYHATLEGEPHVRDIAHLTTLAGYVHWQLSGEKLLGIGEASGMFPIDSSRGDYDAVMLEKYNALSARQGVSIRLEDILPRVLLAGDRAGRLTPEGALRLDPSGGLEPGAVFCPPEGDAGTGMVATNAVRERSGNVSAGTSIFAMLVLEKPLSKLHEEIDMVTTPTGKPVAMVHCNNCSSDIDAWMRMFGSVLSLMNVQYSKDELYYAVYNEALKGAKDGGGLVSFNYYSGEPITGLDEGRPLFARLPDSELSLANFARSLLNSALSTLRIGMDILRRGEGVSVDVLQGHGGIFRTPLVAQTLMAAALDCPVSVMETAGEGGAWGIALLAAFTLSGSGQSLEDYLDDKVFASARGETIRAQAADIQGFNLYLERYIKAIAIEKAAVLNLN